MTIEMRMSLRAKSHAPHHLALSLYPAVTVLYSRSVETLLCRNGADARYIHFQTHKQPSYKAFYVAGYTPGPLL